MLAKKKGLRLKDALYMLGFSRVGKGRYPWQLSSKKGFHYIKVKTKTMTIEHSLLKVHPELNFNGAYSFIDTIEQIQELMRFELETIVEV